MDLESIAEQVFEHLSIAGSEADTLAGSYSDLASTSGHSQDGRHKKDGCQKLDGSHKQDGYPPKDDCPNQDGCNTLDRRSKDGRRTPRLSKTRVTLPSQTFKQDGRLCLNFIDAISGAPNRSYYKLFRGILSWINPDINVFICSEKTQCFSHDHELNDHVRPQKKTVDIPDLAVVLFLQEEQTSEEGLPGKMSQVKEFFQHKPWRFHHSEWVGGQGRIQACPQSNHDYFFVKHDLPLCSVRQIHCGEEHIRLVRFVTAAHWKDSLKLYSLLLGQEADAMKQDFCLFTIEKFGEVDLQLALKKLPKGIEPRHTQKCVLSFKIKDLGHLVPLLPHTCIRIAEHRWKTHDLDRNEIHILVEDTSPKPIRAPLPRHSRPKSNSRVSHSQASHSRQHSSSSESQASAGLSCSAFTPVHTTVENIKSESSDSGSKLSPRVFLNKEIPPEVVSKVQTGLSIQNQSREVYSPMTVEQDYEHQHTDSGFMDERSDDSMDNQARLQVYTQVQVHPVPDHCNNTPAQPQEHADDSCVTDPATLPQIEPRLSRDSSNCDIVKSSVRLPSKSQPLCHSSPKSEHQGTPPTLSAWDTCLKNSTQDTGVTNSVQDTRTKPSTQDTNIKHSTHDTKVHCNTQGTAQNIDQHCDTFSRDNVMDTHKVNTTQDTQNTGLINGTQDSKTINTSHLCACSARSKQVSELSHQVLNAESIASYSDAHIAQAAVISSNTLSQNTEDVKAQVQTSCSKPQLPTYQQAVSLLAAQRHQAGLRTAKLIKESELRNESKTLHESRTIDSSTEHHNRESSLDDNVFVDEANEGEPETEPTSILTDTRRTIFQRRPSSNGKRVRFNDVNENFTYEPVEIHECMFAKEPQENNDVFIENRIENKAEGSECTVTFDEASEYQRSMVDEPFYQKYCHDKDYGSSSNLQWHSTVQQNDSDTGFYI